MQKAQGLNLTEGRRRDSIKLNKDGSFVASKGYASAGGVLRDNQGNWIKCFVLSLENAKPLMLSFGGVYKSLKLPWNEGYKDVCVESDNLIATS